MMQGKTLELLGKKFKILPLPLKYATDIIDCENKKIKITFEFKAECMTKAVQVLTQLEGSELPVALTIESINQIFLGHAMTFGVVWEALMGVTFDDDLKKLEEHRQLLKELFQ